MFCQNKLFGNLVLVLGLVAIPVNANAAALCALASPNFNPTTDAAPPQFATSQMASINGVLCSQFSCPPYRLWQNIQAGNANVTLDQNGFTIRYQPNFMNNVIQRFGMDATSGILAHELGHVIDIHNSPGPVPQAEREARADRYAGCAFALSGAPQSRLAPMAQTLHALGESPGYPTVSQRTQLLINGYNSCLAFRR